MKNDRWLTVVFVSVMLFLVAAVARHVVMTIKCDQSHCDHGQPEMVRGMWFYECMCIEKPVRP